MAFRNSNDQGATESGKDRGFFGRMFPERKTFRLRSTSRSPYRDPALTLAPRRFAALVLFAAGMAYLEAACVVYLWESFYPGGFSFPLFLDLTSRQKALVGVELGRELATIAMLVGCAIAAGRTAVQRVASFMFAFGVWDIFYYLWLRVMTKLTYFPDFPASPGTWDILFLIPVPWTGPVYAPMVVAATFILFAVVLLFAESRGVRIKPDVRFWVIEAGAALMILASFLWNFPAIMDKKIPSFYPWWLLLPGEIIAITALVYLVRDCFYTEK